MSSYNDCIKFSLDIQDTNIIFEDFFYDEVDPNQKIYQAVLLQPSCPKCGSANLIHTSRLKTNIRYITANASKPVFIRLFKQRVLCRDCNQRSMAQSSLVDKHCCIANTAKRKILSALTEDRSMTSIARENNVSVNTVQRVLGKCSHRFLDDYDHNWHYKVTLIQEQVVMEGISCNKELENAYNLMQDFIKYLDTGDTAKLQSLIYSKESVGSLMHKTLLTFKRNFKAVLNGATYPYSNGCIEGFNRKIKQIERTAFGYSSFTNLLARIRLEENIVKEKEPSSYLAA